MLVLVKMASKSVTRSIGLLYTHVGLSIALILWISGKGSLGLNTHLQRLPFSFFFFFFFLRITASSIVCNFKNFPWFAGSLCFLTSSFNG